MVFRNGIRTDDELPDLRDYPCEVCGLEAGQCICPECPACHETGDPECYRDGNPLALVAVPIANLWEAERKLREEEAAEARAFAWVEESEIPW